MLHIMLYRVHLIMYCSRFNNLVMLQIQLQNAPYDKDQNGLIGQCTTNNHTITIILF